MAGTWRGVATPALLAKEMVIDSVSGSAFSGTKTSLVKDRSRSRVTVAITGTVTEDALSFKYGNILYLKDPVNGKWWTCTDCKQVNRLNIHADSLILSTNIEGCTPQCNGESRYYRLLCEYDSATQLSLVNLWGTAADVAAFWPCKLAEVPAMAKTGTEKQPQQPKNDSTAIARRQQQRVEDSLRNALTLAEKQRKQFVKDSIALVRRRQKRLEDSISNAVALANKERKQFVKDSLATAKRLQQQAEDSLNAALAVAEQQRQQRLNDSLKAVAALPPKPPTQPPAKLSADTALTTRDNVLLQTYRITKPDILLEVFDNAQIDGDRISIYHNGQLIVQNQTLQKEPITYSVRATAASREHTFVMIAENLGRIAPNTALMRITAGGQSYRLSVRTDLSTNAKIVFTYDGD